MNKSVFDTENLSNKSDHEMLIINKTYVVFHSFWDTKHLKYFFERKVSWGPLNFFNTKVFIILFDLSSEDILLKLCNFKNTVFIAKKFVKVIFA